MNQYTLSLIDRTVHYSFCWRLRRPVLLFEVTQISLSLITVNLEMLYFTTVKTTHGAVVYRSPRATHTMSPITRVQRRPPHDYFYDSAFLLSLLYQILFHGPCRPKGEGLDSSAGRWALPLSLNFGIPLYNLVAFTPTNQNI